MGGRTSTFENFYFLIDPLHIDAYLSAVANPALMPARRYNAARPYSNTHTKFD